MVYRISDHIQVPSRHFSCQSLPMVSKNFIIQYPKSDPTQKIIEKSLLFDLIRWCKFSFTLFFHATITNLQDQSSCFVFIDVIWSLQVSARPLTTGMEPVPDILGLLCAVTMVKRSQGATPSCPLKLFKNNKILTKIPRHWGLGFGFHSYRYPF